ncbi:hypothetical protein [Nocardia higoensis]|uniref:hypothetical protein n=1 Tax=Nocardia higoensis TaxID=228599 RepID=UPI0002D9708D|nr:hypothetical protein [Nocardia higoensis]
MHTPRVAEVTAYLISHGWDVTGRWRDAQVWSLREFDVLVPAGDDLADSEARLRDLTRCVAEAEDRSPRSVWRDIGSPPADLISLRTAGEGGAVSLPRGVRTVAALRDLLLLCAREVVDEERAESARGVLDQARLALNDQPFGVDVTLPFAVGEVDPLGRRTAMRVLHSSKAIADALDSDVDGIERFPEMEVSDQVCRALAGLAGPDRVVLGFRWASGDLREGATVEIPGGASEVIRAAIRTRRQRVQPVVGVVEGPVIELADDTEGDRRRITVRGVLRVDGSAVGRRRAVTVRLPGDPDYLVALAAHRDGRAVRAEGRVTTTGRRPGIDVTTAGFTVIQDSPR